LQGELSSTSATSGFLHASKNLSIPVSRLTHVATRTLLQQPFWLTGEKEWKEVAPRVLRLGREVSDAPPTL